jgi:hypothetical protein
MWVIKWRRMSRLRNDGEGFRWGKLREIDHLVCSHHHQQTLNNYQCITYHSLEQFWLGRVRFRLEEFMYWKRFLSQLPDFNQATVVTIRSYNQGICVFTDDELELCDVAICEESRARAVSRVANGKNMTA